MSIPASPDDSDPSVRGAHPAELVQLRPISIDDWSDVRYVHREAFRTVIAPRVSPQCAHEFMALLDTPAYVDRLMSSDLVGAWLDGQLAGTAGWLPTDPYGRVARIEGLFVQPLFTFMGLGSLLLAHTEARAHRAGYTVVTAPATSSSVPFFLRHGYDIYVQGVGVTDLPSAVPMFLMRKQEPAAVLPFAHASGAPVRLSLAAADDDRNIGLVRRPASSAHKLLVED